jgi:hypothetical protein
MVPDPLVMKLGYLSGPVKTHTKLQKEEIRTAAYNLNITVNKLD